MQRDNLPNPYIPTTMRKCKCYNNAQKNKRENIKLSKYQLLNISSLEFQTICLNFYSELNLNLSNNCCS